MIKAKKGLLITLFAAMMMFAFGAASVFAADVDGNWNADYSEVTVDGTTYTPTTEIKVVREWVGDGMIKAYVDDSAVDPAALPENKAKPVYFYDFTGAKLAANGAALYSTYTKTNFEALFSTAPIDGLIVTVPSYVKDASTITPKTKALTAAELKGWTVKATQPADYDKDSLADQKFTIAGEIESTNANGSATNPYRVDNNEITADVVVKGTTQTSADVNFFKDEVSAKIADAIAFGKELTAPVTDNAEVPVTFTYDGAAHKVVGNEVAGFPVTWEVLNTKTGKYDAVGACPEVTNVGDTAKVKATITWTETKTVSGTTTTTTHKVINTFVLSVGANAKMPFFGFDKDGNLGNFLYGIEGSEFDAYSFIQAKARETDADTLKAAVEADQETLVAYFKDFYEVTTETTKANPDVIKMAMKEKKLSDSEVKALEKKYEALMKNYGVAAGSKLPIATTEANGSKATMNTNGNGLIIPEIEFVDSPTAVTYKAKKLKKKEASFTVTAVATNGQAVTYKLINAPAKITIDKTSGTITLAKGLKKGKYNITVKAYIPMGFDGKNDAFTVPSETHAIKIKVKK